MIMKRTEIINEYFEWLYYTVCENRFSKHTDFRKLLRYLHSIEFTYTIPNDGNRAKKGENLRWVFSWENNYDYEEIEKYLTGPCSMLEMLVSVAISCEEIMDDPQIGNRTGQWFWNMIVNLGLGSMIDSRFDKEYVDEVVRRFLNRQYDPDGTGGLFTIRNCDVDLRTVEIWYQLCWYLDSIT